MLQQGERERSALRQELQLLRGKEAELQEELDAAAQVRSAGSDPVLLFLTRF